MPSSIMPDLGREATIEACGRRWKVARMDIDVLESFIDWLRPQLPDPFDALAKILPHLPPMEARAQIAEAKASALLDYDSPAVKTALTSKRGSVHLFRLLLQVHQPDVTLSEAFRVAGEIGQERMTQIFSTAAGSAGKAEAPAAPGNGSTGVESPRA